MSSTSGRHAREFYGQDQNEEVAADYDEEASNPKGAAVTFTISKATSAITHPNTDTVTANVKYAGANQVNVAVAAVSDDTDVATVAGDGFTNSSGNLVLTITSVAAGTCNVTITCTALKLNRTVAVTVT